MANTSDLIRIGFDVESGMKKALAEIEKGNADIQKKVDGNHIEYKISGDDSQLKSLISEISKLKPHALTVDFDDSDFRKRLGDIESLTANKAKSIGDNFANSISKEIQNSNIESTLQNILGNGVKVNKTQIAKKIGELRTEIKNGLGENNVNLSSILGDSSQLEKYISMYREMATLSEYIEHNMGGRKLAKVADLNSLENISKEITTLFSSADFSTVTTKINEEFSSSFEKVREFLYQMSNIGTGSFGDLTNITNILNSQIDSVDKNIKELEGDISSLGNRANSIRELSSAITENDIDYKTDKYQKLISAIKEYINLGGKIKDAGTFSIGNLKNKSLSDLWDFLGQSNQLKENTKAKQLMEQMILQREKLSNILGGISSIGNPLDSSVADTGRIINNQSEAFHNMSIVGTQSIETIIQKLNELKSIIIEISDMKLLPEITSEEMLSLKNSFSKINDYLREVSNVTLLPELDKNFNDILKQKINNLGSYELKINPVVTDDSVLKKVNENTLKAVSKKNVASSEETTVVKNNPVVSSPTIPDYSVNIEQLSNLEKTVELVKQAFYNMSTAISETKIANEIATQKEITDINNLFASLDTGIEKYRIFIEIANNANLNATSKNEDINSIKQVESATVEAIQAKKDFATANEAVQTSVHDSESPLKLEAKLMDQVAESARQAANAKKTFVEANKQVADSASKSNGSLSSSNINNIEGEKSRKQGISDSKTFNKDWDDAIRYNAKFDKALLNTKKIMDSLSTPKVLENDFLRLIDEVNELDTKLKNCKLDPSEYNKLIDSKTKEYNKKVTIQQNRDVEEYNARAEAERNAEVNRQKEENIKKIEREKNVIDELNKSISRYEKLQKRIANGKSVSSDETEAQELLNRIHELQRQDILSSDKLNDSNRRLENIRKEVEDITKRLNESSSNGKSIQDRISKITNNFNTSKDNANSNEFNHSVDTQLYRDAANAVGSLNDKLSQNSSISKAEIDHASELVLKFSQLAQAEQTLNTKTQSLSDAQKIVNQHLRTMTGTSGEILKQGVFKTGKNGISTLLTTIRDTSGEIKDLKFTYNDSVVSMQNTTKSLETQLIGLPKVFDTLKKKSKELLVYWTANALNPYAIIYRGRRIFNVVKELDDTFTEMRKVSDESVSSLKAYQKESFSTADAVGTTAKQIQNSTADWMRLGESLNEAANSAKISNVLLKVSEFDNIDDATKSLTSMAQAYKELSKTEIVDILNQIGNNFSISTDELATSLQSSAATLKLMGNDLAESVAMVTTANSIMQDPDSVSAGLRTISLRIVGTEESEKELEALGEEVDAFVKDTNSKKQQIIADYTAVASNGFKGFNILDDNGNYKNTYEILSGIADIYKEIVEQDKKLGTNHATALVEELAGKNRSSIASAILSDPEQLKAVKESAENADGSAQEELDKYLDSIDGKLEQLTNKAQELASVTFDSDFLKDTISSLTTILNLVTKLVNFTGTGSLFSGGVGIAINKMLG